MLKLKALIVCTQQGVEALISYQYFYEYQMISRENPQLFYCACDGGSRPKAIDPYGYHLVGCKNGANAIRLYDEVVVTVAKLFRTLCVDAIVEPMRLFTDAGRRRA